jgi:hypothetical protein
LAVGVASLLLFGSSRATAKQKKKAHPHIHRALYELREARTELKEAAHDFGGHRKKALEAVNAAITQLEKALEFSGDKRPFKGDPKGEIYKKYKNFPHIRNAIVELKETVSEMKKAAHDYGGHRKQALIDTQAAIKQLELCIKFAKK